MLTFKLAFYKSTDKEEELLVDIFVFKADRMSELVAKIKKWLEELGPY